MKLLAVIGLSIGLIIGTMSGCGGAKSGNDSQHTGVKNETVENIFHDPVFQKIYTLQNARDPEGLEAYLTHKTAVYRKAASLAFASVQEPKSVPAIGALLKDENQTVRSAAAYALGQTGSETAEPLLIDAFKNESIPAVQRDILEALGKCGTPKGLEFITAIDTGKKEIHDDLWTGLAWGVYRYGNRQKTSDKGTALALSLLDQEKPQKARMIAANYLARTRDLDLKDHHQTLGQAFDRENDIYTRMALAMAMGKAETPETLTRLKHILTILNEDYRVKVNALRALGRFQYDSVKSVLMEQAASQNLHLAVAATEFFIDKGIEADALNYFKIAGTLTSWRPRTNMLTAALKHLSPKDQENRKTISQFTLDTYNKTTNQYEKAWLMNALALDPANRAFLEARTFDTQSPDPLLSTYGMNALCNMFSAAHKAGSLDKEGFAVFAAILERGLGSRDNSMVTLSGNTLKNKDYGFDTFYKDKDTGFLQDALTHCQLPADFEAWQEVKAAIKHITGKEVESPAEKPALRDIDWELVKSISPDKKILLQTSKGDITMQLLVEQSPGSASNFLRLIREDYYKGGAIHRVVPNFVVQDGCPRGDGWGGPPYAIGSELGPLYYDIEGMVGMASAGKDTEGSQWFITHSPTPHLDGRYTIFAKVIHGMDVVHQLEVGDKIEKFKEL